jgi:hypothetical protein
MIAALEAISPGLIATGYRVTSPPDDDYNCIAWAADDDTDWWWPDQTQIGYWPPAIPRAMTLGSFRDAFATLGYADCADEQLEAGFEKIAIFALVGVPKHASRQLETGLWTSKLGEREDIEHSLHALTGVVYGSVAVIMKRPRTTSPPTAIV